MRRASLVVLVVLALGLPAGAVALAMWPQSGYFGAVRTHGPRDRPLVALTFDDGPNAPVTLEIGEALALRGVRATFFLVGANVDRDPGTARRLTELGHVVGNHSYRHQKRDAIFDYSYEELERAQEAIASATGHCPTLYRPPNGFHTPWQLDVARDTGLTTVAWGVQTYDWEDPSPERIVERVLEQVGPGSIVLLHDGSDLEQGVARPSTAAAIGPLVEALEGQGYRLVTVDELLGVAPHLACPEE